MSHSNDKDSEMENSFDVEPGRQPNFSEPHSLNNNNTKQLNSFCNKCEVTANGYPTDFKKGNTLYKMTVNPCSPVGGQAQCTSSCSVCQQTEKGDQSWCCGGTSKNNFKWMELSGSNAGKEGVVLHVTGGEGKTPRNANISFVCGDKADLPPTCIGEDESTATYIFEWSTPYACNGKSPSNGSNNGGGLSGGSIMMITIACVVFVYLVGGIVFNKFVRHQEKVIDLIPNREFWTTIPGLVVDGVKFIFNKIKGRTSYAQL